MNDNTLIFEGTGWDKAESSVKSGVGNCRIRTRIRNNDGRLIYLEMTGHEVTKNSLKKYNGYNFVGNISHCFYADSQWDARRNYSSELSYIEGEHFEYNKESILKFVNEKLNCSFDNVEVINDNSVRVHDTYEQLSDCSIEGYKPYKEVEIHISELDGIVPLSQYTRGAHYRISHDYVKQIPGLNRWMQERTEREKQQFPNLSYYANLRWDTEGIIICLEVSARQNFVLVGLGSEELQSAIDAIKKAYHQVNIT